MLIGPEYFPSLRAAEEARLTEALERRRIALDRRPPAPDSFSLRLHRLLTRSGRQVAQCRSELEEVGSPLQAGPGRA